MDNSVSQLIIWLTVVLAATGLVSLVVIYRLRDQLKQSAQKIAEMQTRYETEILKKQREVQTAAIRKQRTALIGIGISLVLTLVLAVFLVRLNIQKNRTNRLLNNSYKEIQERETALKKANAAKDRFFSIIAHDLKNPFNVIFSFVRLFKRNYDDFTREQVHELIEELQSKSSTTFALLENLLEWSRSQTGKTEYRPIKLSVMHAVKESIDILQPQADSKNIRLESHIAEDFIAKADKRMTGAVLRNLISNAIKFTRNGGKVTVSAEQKNKHVHIMISDTGVGISTKKLPKLFRIDTKVSTAGTDDEKGSGLGLILCREFVEKQGGKISAQSQLGQGSQFMFTLPTAVN